MSKVELSSADALQAALDAFMGRGNAPAADKGKGKDEAEPFRDLLRSLSRARTPPAEGRSVEDAVQPRPAHVKLVDSSWTKPKPEIDADGDTPAAEVPVQMPAPAQADARPIDWLGLPSQVVQALPSQSPQAEPANPEPAETTTEPRVTIKLANADVPMSASRAMVVDDAIAMPSEPFAPQQSLSLALARAVTSASDAPPPSKVVVLQQETHFQPVPQLAPVQKIADVVISEMQGLSDMASVRAADLAAPEPASKPSEPLKVLTIQLDPPELGTVTVKLRLVGDTVQVEMAASRHETAQILQQQREVLSDIMRQAGYSSSVAQVHHGGPDAVLTVSNHMQSSTGQHQQPNQSFAFDGGGRGAGDFQDGGSRHDRQDRQPFHQRDDAHHDHDPGRPGGALYL